MLLDMSRPFRSQVTFGSGRPNPTTERNSVALEFGGSPLVSLVVFEATSTIAAVEWNMGIQ